MSTGPRTPEGITAARSGSLGFSIGLSNLQSARYLAAVSTVQDIEAAIPRLSRAEVEDLRAWIDEFLEDQLGLTAEVRAKLDQSRREIAQGQYTMRQPQ